MGKRKTNKLFPHLEEGQKIGTCSWCEEKGIPIYKDTKRCEDCDSRFAYCEICKTEQFEEDLCRHLYRNIEGEWSGSGGYPDPDAKKPLFKLLELMPKQFAKDVKLSIENKRFYLFTVGSLFSVDFIELGGINDDYRKYSKRLLEIGSDDEQGEKTSDGYHWLVSLYEDETPEANAQTIAWIEEFLK